MARGHGAGPRGATPALAVLGRAGVWHRVHRFGHDPTITAFGREAASALDVAPARVLKTLVCASGASLVLAVLPVTSELDLKLLATVLGTRSAALADPAVAERATGYVVGGISPIGSRRPLPVVVDEAAAGWQTVFVSGGRRGLEIELAPDDLLMVSGGHLEHIRRDG